jgi:hypothetical protein
MTKRFSQPFSIALLLTAGSISLVYEVGRLALQAPVFAYGANSDRTTQIVENNGTSILTQEATAPEVITPGVEICVDLPDWQRPTEQAQEKYLETMPRYRDVLQEEPLLSLAKAWWGHEIFSFTTYGLSARTDPHYLSGIWSALDHVWDCYSGDQPQLINQGDMAELWLLHQRLVGIQWLEDEYLVTVESGTSGLQIVHFERVDTNIELPLNVVNTEGEPIAAMSGDW